jgi:hypothetical protein
MKRVLILVGTLFCITNSTWGMWGDKNPYTQIPSPQDNKPYCWTESCVHSPHDGEDAQTLANLQGLQSSVFIEAMLENSQGKLVSRDTKVCVVSDDPHDVSHQASPQTLRQDAKDTQKAMIAIKEVTVGNNRATVEYYLRTGGNESTASVTLDFNNSEKQKLNNGLMLTISAMIASSNAALK